MKSKPIHYETYRASLPQATKDLRRAFVRRPITSKELAMERRFKRMLGPGYKSIDWYSKDTIKS